MRAEIKPHSFQVAGTSLEQPIIASQTNDHCCLRALLYYIHFITDLAGLRLDMSNC